MVPVTFLTPDIIAFFSSKAIKTSSNATVEPSGDDIKSTLDSLNDEANAILADAIAQ